MTASRDLLKEEKRT